MEEKLKKGWTTSNFAQYLQCSEEEFLDTLQKTFSAKAVRWMKSTLERNDKRFKKRVVKAQKRKDSCKGEIIQMENVAEVMQFKTKELSREEVLETLMKESSRLHDSICSEELTHNELVAKRKKLYDNLRTKKEKLLVIQEEIFKHKSDIETIINELSQISSEIFELNLNMSEQRSRLNELSTEIRMLQKIAIYVYNNGEIECENFEVIDTGWKEKFSEIVELDDVESLIVKQIKQLAKVLVFVQYLKEHNLEFEITFENDQIQKAYQRLI